MKKIAFLCLFPLFTFAGNLNELLEIAEQNKQVESSHYSLEATKEKEYSTKSSYYPSLSLGANQTFNQEKNMFTPEKSTVGTAKISYTIYDGGRREALSEQQLALIKSATFSLASVQNNISLNIIYYYYNYLSTQSTREATLQKIEQLEAERYRLEKYLSVGSATDDELQKIVSIIEQTKVELLTLENSLNNITNALEYLTGQEVNVQKGSIIDLKETKIEEGKRLDILALEERVQSNKAEIKMAKAPNLPAVTIQNVYSRYDNDYLTPNVNNLEQQNSIQLAMEWKVFDFGSTSSNVEATHQNYLAKNSELNYEKAKAKASFKSAVNSYKTSLAKIEASKAKLQASEMTYELVKKKFQHGIVNNVSYLDALSDKFNSYSQLQTSLNEIEYQKAVLLYEMGKEIKGTIK